MSKRKPHNDVIGYVCELRNRVTGFDYVVIYDRNKGFDCDADGYVVVCEAHGTMVSETSLPRARMSMKSVEFCQECHAQHGVQRTVCTACKTELTESNVYCPTCGLWNPNNRR